MNIVDWMCFKCKLPTAALSLVILVLYLMILTS